MRKGRARGRSCLLAGQKAERDREQQRGRRHRQREAGESAGEQRRQAASGRRGDRRLVARRARVRRIGRCQPRPPHCNPQPDRVDRQQRRQTERPGLGQALEQVFMRAPRDDLGRHHAIGVRPGFRVRGEVDLKVPRADAEQGLRAVHRQRAPPQPEALAQHGRARVERFAHHVLAGLETLGVADVARGQSPRDHRRGQRRHDQRQHHAQRRPRKRPPGERVEDHDAQGRAQPRAARTCRAQVNQLERQHEQDRPGRVEPRLGARGFIVTCGRAARPRQRQPGEPERDRHRDRLGGDVAVAECRAEAR